MADRLTELPEVLLAMVTFRVGLWKPDRVVNTYSDLLGLVRVAFKNMQAFRLSCTAVARMSKARQYFYDLTWKLWSVATSVELVPPAANLLGMQIPGCLHLANLSYFKDLDYLEQKSKQQQDSNAGYQEQQQGKSKSRKNKKHSRRKQR